MIYPIKKIENIEIIREVGSGGMGVVYEGHDTLLDRRVAVKLLLPHIITPQSKKRFLREASAMARINHPSVVNVYSVGEVNINNLKIPYFTMEYVEGKSLADLITRLQILKDNNPEELKEYGYISHVKNLNYGNYFLKEFLKIPIEEKEWVENVCVFISTIADALAEIHNEGIIHRDIKPSNILISKKGPKIADFGLVKNISSNSISTQTDFVGTIKYSAPEIFLKGKHSIQSDIYSLGVIFYELLTLSYPFDISSDDSPAYLMNKILKSDPKPPHLLNKSISEQISSIIMKMIDKNPKNRFSSMKDTSEAIMLSKQTQIEKIFTDIKSIFKKDEEFKVSDADKELSNEKLRLALSSYAAIDFVEALSYIRDTIYFNPLNLDGYLLAILISLHGYMFPVDLSNNFNNIKKHLDKSDDVNIEKAKIIELFISKDRRWIDYAINHAKKYSNFILYNIVARKRKDLSEYFLKKAIKEFPEFSDFLSIILEVYSKKDEFNIKNIERFKGKGNADFLARIILIEKYLWDTYDIKKAEEELSEIEKRYPYNSTMLIYRLYIDLIKGNEESFIININKIISASSDDVKLMSYITLYQFHFRKGDIEKAERYFKIAKNITTYKIKTVEEIHSEAKCIDYSIFDNSDRRVIEFSYSLFLNDFVKYLLESNLMWFFKINNKTIILNEDESVHFYYISSKPSGQIDFVPLGNFFDLKGNILKTTYRQLSTNSYLVEVEETEDLKSMPVIFSGIQQNLLRKDDKKIIDFNEKILVPRISKRVFAISKRYKLKSIESNLSYSKYEIEDFSIVVFDIDTLKSYSPYDLEVKIYLEDI